MSAVMEALEGKLEVYNCLSDKDPEKLTCDLGRSMGNCSTRLLWSRLREAIWQTLESITLAELSADVAPLLGTVLAGGASHNCEA